VRDTCPLKKENLGRLYGTHVTRTANREDNKRSNNNNTNNNTNNNKRNNNNTNTNNNNRSNNNTNNNKNNRNNTKRWYGVGTVCPGGVGTVDPCKKTDGYGQPGPF